VAGSVQAAVAAGEALAWAVQMAVASLASSPAVALASQALAAPSGAVPS
jgi:hypothetical protein